MPERCRSYSPQKHKAKSLDGICGAAVYIWFIAKHRYWYIWKNDHCKFAKGYDNSSLQNRLFFISWIMHLFDAILFPFFMWVCMDSGIKPRVCRTSTLHIVKNDATSIWYRWDYKNILLLYLSSASRGIFSCLWVCSFGGIYLMLPLYSAVFCCCMRSRKIMNSPYL